VPLLGTRQPLEESSQEAARPRWPEVSRGFRRPPQRRFPPTPTNAPCAAPCLAVGLIGLSRSGPLLRRLTFFQKSTYGRKAPPVRRADARHFEGAVFPLCQSSAPALALQPFCEGVSTFLDYCRANSTVIKVETPSYRPRSEGVSTFSMCPIRRITSADHPQNAYQSAGSWNRKAD